MDNKDFDLSAIEALDDAKMEVIANGGGTGWFWTFAGPGHERTIAQSNRLSRETLARDRLKEQAQTNNKKWKAPEVSPEERLADNVRYVLDRLLGWSDIKMKGEAYPYSEENARKILMDPKMATLRNQSIEFLNDDSSFTQRSATS